MSRTRAEEDRVLGYIQPSVRHFQCSKGHVWEAPAEGCLLTGERGVMSLCDGSLRCIRCWNELLAAHCGEVTEIKPDAEVRE